MGDLDSSSPFRADLIVRYRFDLSLSVGLKTRLSESSNIGPSISLSMLLCYVLHSTLEAVVRYSISVRSILSHAVNEEGV